MYQLTRLIAIGSIVSCFLIQAQGVDKYTDENRPYEFGFTIEGEQHRHEKKDKNGIIMGEFGFITADGVYHVTVYATDEQGRFKILSMKNIRVKPYPTWHPKNSERQGHSLSLPSSQAAPASKALSTSQQSLDNQYKQIIIEPPKNSCSHCSLPTTTTRAPQILNSNNNRQNNPSRSGAPEDSNSQYFQGAKSPSSFPNQQNTLNLQYPQQTSGLSQSYPPEQLTDINSSQYPSQQGPIPLQQGSDVAKTNSQQGSGTAQDNPIEQQNNFNSPKTSQQSLGTLQQGASTGQSYPQQSSGSQQNYPTGQQNSLNNLQSSSQQSLGTPQQGKNTEQIYAQQGSEPQQNYPTGQQNSFNNLQYSSRQGLGTPQEAITGQVLSQKGSGPPQNYPTGQRNKLNSPQTEFQQAIGGPQLGVYAEEGSGHAQSYPAGQSNSLNGARTDYQQALSGPQLGVYPQEGSGHAQNYPAGQQNSLNSPQSDFQQALGSPQLGVYSQDGSRHTQNYPAGQQNSLNSPQIFSPQGLGATENSLRQETGTGQNYLQQGIGSHEIQGGIASQYPGEVQNQPIQTQHGSGTGERTPKQLNEFQEQLLSLQNAFPQNGQPLSKKPTLIAAQMQIVDKNTDIYHRGPGENEGLPEGLKKGDIAQLLYTFNYTLGFQGHFEEGYTNGVKQGYYFVTGRNGVRTRVDYVADAKGFRPKITQEVLDLLSDDVPKPETEKDEKYGLKGYEFKWLYYPVETKTR